MAAFLPAAAAGLLGGAWVQEHLFGLWPIVAAWLLGGVAILLVAWRRAAGPAGDKALEALSLRAALLIGLAQVLALWPGTSRSLVTIVGGVLVGLGLPAAVEFSFLLGVLTLGAATAWELLGVGGQMVAEFGAWPLVAGFVAAALSAALAVQWLVGWVQRHGLSVFGVYRIALALLVAALLLSGRL